MYIYIYIKGHLSIQYWKSIYAAWDISYYNMGHLSTVWVSTYAVWDIYLYSMGHISKLYFISWWLVIRMLFVGDLVIRMFISWWLVIGYFISWWLVMGKFIFWWWRFWSGIPWPYLWSRCNSLKCPSLDRPPTCKFPIRIITTPYRLIPWPLWPMLKHWRPDNLAMRHLSLLHRHVIHVYTHCITLLNWNNYTWSCYISK